MRRRVNIRRCMHRGRGCRGCMFRDRSRTDGRGHRSKGSVWAGGGSSGTSIGSIGNGIIGKGNGNGDGCIGNSANGSNTTTSRYQEQCGEEGKTLALRWRRWRWDGGPVGRLLWRWGSRNLFVLLLLVVAFLESLRVFLFLCEVEMDSFRMRSLGILLKVKLAISKMLHHIIQQYQCRYMNIYVQVYMIISVSPISHTHHPAPPAPVWHTPRIRNTYR